MWTKLAVRSITSMSYDGWSSFLAGDGSPPIDVCGYHSVPNSNAVALVIQVARLVSS